MNNLDTSFAPSLAVEAKLCAYIHTYTQARSLVGRVKRTHNNLQRSPKKESGPDCSVRQLWSIEATTPAYHCLVTSEFVGNIITNFGGGRS